MSPSSSSSGKAGSFSEPIKPSFDMPKLMTLREIGFPLNSDRFESKEFYCITYDPGESEVECTAYAKHGWTDSYLHFCLDDRNNQLLILPSQNLVLPLQMQPSELKKNLDDYTKKYFLSDITSIKKKEDELTDGSTNSNSRSA